MWTTTRPRGRTIPYKDARPSSMQLTVGLGVTVILALLTVGLRLVRRHPVTFESFAQDALAAFGVGVAAGLVVVPTIGISWAFVHDNSRLTPAIIAPYDQNGLMFSIIAGAAAATYLAVKAYLEHMPPRAVTKPDAQEAIDTPARPARVPDETGSSPVDEHGGSPP